MRRLYINKECFVIFFVFLVGLFGLFADKLINIKPSSPEATIVYNCVMIGIIVMALYLNTMAPIFIMERKDRFIIQYEHKRRTILKRDITAFRYPVKHKRSLCYRIVVNDNEALTFFGMWGRLRDTACNWEREHGLPVYQDEPNNNYKSDDCCFSFVPRFSSFFTDRRAVLIFAFAPGMIRMIRPPFNMVNVILFFMMAAAAYLICMYLTSFHVADGVLKTENAVARRYNHTIPLDSIKWIMIADANLCIKLKDGRAIVVRYKLSKEQLTDFSNAFGSMGIPVIY